METTGVVRASAPLIGRGGNNPKRQGRGGLSRLTRLGESIPEPSKARKNDLAVSLPALMAAKAAIFLALKEAKISKSELAKRLKCDEKEIR